MGVNAPNLLDHGFKFQIGDYVFRLVYYLPLLSPGPENARSRTFPSSFIHIHSNISHYSTFASGKACSKNVTIIHFRMYVFMYYIDCFSSEAICSSDYIAPNSRMRVNRELERMQEEATLAFAFASRGKVGSGRPKSR
jgi:hypothetical protein